MWRVKSRQFFNEIHLSVIYALQFCILHRVEFVKDFCLIQAVAIQCTWFIWSYEDDALGREFSGESRSLWWRGIVNQIAQTHGIRCFDTIFYTLLMVQKNRCTNLIVFDGYKMAINFVNSKSASLLLSLKRLECVRSQNVTLFLKPFSSCSLTVF